MKVIPRRTFLRSTASGIGTVMSLPLLEAMFGSDSAYADAPGAYPRFFCFYVPNGVIEEKWYPSEGSKTEFDLTGTALEAFQTLGLKNDISLYRGMHNAAHLAGSRGNKHMVGISSFLTGVGIPSESSQTHSPSLDQEVAEALPRTKVHSLQLAGNSELDKPSNNHYFNPLKNALNWGTNNRLLPLKSELRTEFDKLYASASSIPGEGIDRRTLMKISVLDEVQTEREKLVSQLGAADRERMEHYFESLRDVELKLDALANSGDEGGACPKPVAESSIPNPKNGTRNPAIGEHAQIAGKITAQAFSCGLTHAITYAAGGEGAGCQYSDIGINEHFHNSITHNRSGRYNKWVKIDKFHGELCAQIMFELKNTPHGAGNLLDGTAILFGSALGNGDLHHLTDIPLLVGGHFGNWQHGRYHRFNGRDHGDLIDTIRQQMQLPTVLGRSSVPIS